MALRLVSKFRVVVTHLIRSGCLLNHLEPIALLGYDEYLVAQEAELRKSEGPRFTPQILRERRMQWEKNWLHDCKKCWMEVIFQAIKVFFLSRATYKAFANIPGTVVVTREPETTRAGKDAKKAGRGAGAKDQKKPAGSPVPPEFSASNVYTHAEAVLMAWASYHLQRAANLVDHGNSSPAESLVGE